MGIVFVCVCAVLRDASGGLGTQRLFGCGRRAARRELAAALTSSGSLPFPPPRCRSRLSFAFPPSVGVTDEDLSLARSFASSNRARPRALLLKH